MSGSTDNVLASKAMLASVTIRSWSSRKIDRVITTETNDRHKASADAGRYNKALLAKEAILPIVTASGQIRAYHGEVTLPWLDNGARILPAKRFDEYTKRMRQLRADFEAVVKTFCENYPRYVDEAKARLNTMFDPNDYPSPKKIASAFAFEIHVLPIPTAADFRVTIGDSQAAEIRASIEKSTKDATDIAMRDVWSRIASVVEKMVERLRAYQPATKEERAKNTFRDSLVGNVRDLVGILPAFNLTNDSRLEAITARMHEALCANEAEALRAPDAAKLREDTAAAAEKILADVTDYLA